MSTWTKNRQVEGSGGKERTKYAGCERGFVLIIVLIIIAALALLGLAANRNMLADIGIAQNHGGNTRAFYAAEAAGEYVYNQLYQNLQQAGNPQTTGHDYTNALQNSIQGCTISAAPRRQIPPAFRLPSTPACATSIPRPPPSGVVSNAAARSARLV